ncbi:MAG: alpha-glucosidase [Oligoflexus sp.]
MISKALPFVFTGIWLNATTVQAKTYVLGEFHVLIEENENNNIRIDVRHQDDLERSLWSNLPTRSFLEAAIGSETVDYDRASFQFKDRVSKRCLAATIQKVKVLSDQEIQLTGNFVDCPDLQYTLDWQLVSDQQLGFQIELKGDSAFNRLTWRYAADQDEQFYGFGEQFFDFPVKGRTLPIWLEEQGLARGAQPLTSTLRLVGAGATAGDWYTTYSYVPYYLTNKNRSLYLTNYEYLEFNLEKSDEVAINIYSPKLSGRLIYGRTPLDIVSEFTTYTGRMSALPEWTQNGAVLRVSGGEQQVLQDIETALAAGMPIAAVWIEDWVGKRETLLGSRLWWNWEANRDVYPNWGPLIQSLRVRGIRVLNYFNPYLADVVEDQVRFERRFYQEALQNDFLVKQSNQSIFTFGAGLFDAALVDFTNPNARVWMKDIIKGQLSLGVAGWMADFGEALPYDASLFNGSDPRSYHNQYPAEWARLNQEIVSEMGLDDVINFHRSGNIISPRYARLFWTGDQLTSWDHYDGIKTVIPALTSSGLSGWTLNHSEVGGYLSANILFARYQRSKELFLRWPEISVFTALFRTHATNRPEENHQWNTDAETISIFTRYAKLFQALTPYRQQLMAEAEHLGYPLVRHPMLHFPNDPNVYQLPQQFMFGADFWVAPVVDPGVNHVDVYLPKSRWVHLWTGEVFESNGQNFRVAAPLGQPTAFFLDDSEFGHKLRAQLLFEGVIPEKLLD